MYEDILEPNKREPREIRIDENTKIWGQKPVRPPVPAEIEGEKVKFKNPKQP
jgi:hypothetical protein